MTGALLLGLLLAAIAAGTTLLYATLGEIVTERAGMVNLGLEGVVLVGAAVAYAVCAVTGSPVVGVLAAASSGMLMNGVYAYAVIRKGANQLATGLTLLFLGLGVSALVATPFMNDVIVGLPTVSLRSILPEGMLAAGIDLFAVMAVPATAAIYLLLFNTRWGLRLRAVGENPAAAYAAGSAPHRLQFQALMLGGICAGLAGAHLVLCVTLTWAEAMTAGRGFIAVALVMFARWQPWWALAGALLFGGAEALQLQLQARGIDLSPFALNMMPYVLTLAVLALSGKWGRNAAPAYLGRMFKDAESS